MNPCLPERGNADTDLLQGGGEAVEAFVKGVKAMVEKDSKEEQSQMDTS